MKYPDYCKEAIQETLNTYLTFKNFEVPDTFERAGITRESKQYNAETFISLYDAETSVKSHRDFVRILTEIKNTGLLDDLSITVINKLIGDRKLFKKIKFCYDGSYRNNRIWGSPNTVENKYRIRPEIGYELWKQFDYQYPVDKNNVKEYIDWIYNHFDTIFLQICDVSLMSHEFYQKQLDDEFYHAIDEMFFDDFPEEN